MPKEFLMSFSEDSGRPETGVCSHESDWKGVFIRGDNAFHFSLALRAVLDGTKDPWDAMAVDQLCKLLESCREGKEAVAVWRNQKDEVDSEE